MSDNLKEVKDFVALKIDNQREDLPILASEHKKVLDDILEKGGKYTGIPFRSVNDLSNGVLAAGEFSWNGNSMNETAEFDITISATSGDLNNITPIINLLSVGAIIKFKDFVGRSSLLEYISHVTGVDSSNNDILTITVKGYAENTNYLYVAGDNEICVLDFVNLAGGGEVNFADKDGSVQYSSDTDKRTGTHDVANEIYYPTLVDKTLTNTFSNQVVEKVISVINPLDSFGVSGGLGYNGGGKTNYLLQLPKRIEQDFSFDLEIYFAYNSGSNANQAFDTRVKAHISVGELDVVTGEWKDIFIVVEQTTNPDVLLTTASPTPDLIFNFGINANGDYIVGFEYNTIQGYLPCRYNLTNLRIKTNNFNNPIDFIKGWKYGQAWTYYTQGDIKNDFIIKNSYTSNDYFDKNTSGIEIQDINGVSQGTTSLLQMGENLEYNSTTKEIGQILLPAIVNVNDKFFRYGDDNTSLGYNAFHLALNSIGNGATGNYSFTSGFNAQAGGLASIGKGHSVNALGDYSVVIGSSSETYGFATVSLARGGKPYSFGSVNLGIYPTFDSAQNRTSNDLNDVGLKVGSGSDSSNRKDCFTVFKNGAVKFEPLIVSSISNPLEGMIAFNDTTKKHQGYDGTQWNDLY